MTVRTLPIAVLSTLMIWSAVSAMAEPLPAPILASLDQCDVLWTTPGEDSSDSMPLGNGDVAVNAWSEPDGSLSFYISKSDAWSDNARLLKLGRIRISWSPNPFVETAVFRQRLHLHQGVLYLTGRSGFQARLWIDAKRPVIHLQTRSEAPLSMTAKLELWRTEARELTGAEAASAYGLQGNPNPIIVQPDTILPAADSALTWHHRNSTSCYPITMTVQALGGLIETFPDPLLNRTCGGRMIGTDMHPVNDSTLRSEQPSQHHQISIHVLTAQTKTPQQWLDKLDQQIEQTAELSIAEAFEQHCDWWEHFWSRSWIFADTPPPERQSTGGITANNLPLRIGADSDGKHRFRGDMARAALFDRPLDAEEMKRLAGTAAAEAVPDSLQPLAWWRGGDLSAGVIPSQRGGAFPAKVIGSLAQTEEDNIAAIRFAGEGYLEVQNHPDLALLKGFTLSAWIRPHKLPAAGSRIIDKSEAGTSNGYLFDTYPGNSLRNIVKANTLSHKAGLTPGQWVHVAGTFDPATGAQCLYIDGRRAATNGKDSSTTAAQDGDGVSPVTRGYALQRFINAAAGRGAFPIKFNGSLFTVDTMSDPNPSQRFDADYRRWGGCYWFQNTRLPYWSMLAAGDYDMMQPLFKMYLDALPLAKARTQKYFGHPGAFFPETITFWGTWNNANYGWNREGKPDGLPDNRYIRYYWSSALELIEMMLDVVAHTEDTELARQTLLPFATEIIAFYDHHYPERDADGNRVFAPAQALETWHKATNPLPLLAGLKRVLPRLLEELPGTRIRQQKKQWQRLLRELPPLPIGEKNGKRVLLPAEEYDELKNSENPALYAIFPYNLYGVGKDDLELARNTFAERRVKRTGGWSQDAIQAAILGLEDPAADFLYRNFTTHHQNSRFPAFWGPNFDWIPDQDHGGVSMTALQHMLIQCDDTDIHLLPAWPDNWSVDCKLHAPHKTIVRLVYADRQVKSLQVTPPERLRDVKLPGHLSAP